MLSTLILNVNNEPIDIVSGKRAITLIESGKARAIENSTQVLKSASAQYPIPYIIQLKEHINVEPRRYTPFSRKGVFYRDNYTCVYCKVRRGDTIDHVIPQSKGGKNSYDNCVACCSPCNSFKKDLYLDELGWEIPELVTPVWYVIAMRRSNVDSVQQKIWMEYLSEFDPTIADQYAFA